MPDEIIIFFSHCKNISVLFCIGTFRAYNHGCNFPRLVSWIAGNNDETPHCNAEIPVIPTTGKTVAMHGLPLHGSGDDYRGSFFFLFVPASFSVHRSFPPRAKPWLCMGYRSAVRGTITGDYSFFLFVPASFSVHRSFPPRAKPWLCMGYRSAVRGTQLHGLFLFPPLHFLTSSLLLFFPSPYAFSLKYYCSHQKLFTENSIIHQNALHDFGVVDNFSSKS